MRQPPQTVLVVEDNRDLLRVLADGIVTEFDGVKVLTSPSHRHAIDLLRRTSVEVLVADMLMDDRKEAGYDLLLAVKKTSPTTQVVVHTAYADFENAVRCMRAGCFDYVPKSARAEPLFQSIRRALDLSRIPRDTDSLSERLILADWEQIQRSPDTRTKGESLESICSLLFRSIPGWQRIESRLTTRTEEIDLVILNESSDEFWRRFGTFILVECKNWQKQRKPGRKEFDSFYLKIKRRGKADCRLGLFVSLHGVARTFAIEVARIAKEDIVIVILTTDDIWGLICAPDRSEFLKQSIVGGILG